MRSTTWTNDPSVPTALVDPCESRWVVSPKFLAGQVGSFTTVIAAGSRVHGIFKYQKSGTGVFSGWETGYAESSKAQSENICMARTRQARERERGMYERFYKKRLVLPQQ